MPFCDLCVAIPWHSLPKVPPHIAVEWTGHRYIHPLPRWPKEERKIFMHHQSLQALRESAQVSKCELCTLIHRSAKNVEQNLENLRPAWEAGTLRKYAWPTWQLWLTQRRYGGPGFWVLSEDEDEDEQVSLIASIGLCTRENDPLAGVFAGRPIECDAGSANAISRARKWLEECNRHPNCSPGETPLPSRVVDVGSDRQSPFVRLVETDGRVYGHYVSLSYCWGKSREFTTTTTTLEQRKRQILIADLPKTYQDAIRITRELGISYLWIDSLCICQDDHDDWERESAKMLSIYSNAFLTIGATGGKASSQGFLNTRSLPQYVEFEYSSPAIDSPKGHALAFGLPLREEAVPNDYVTMLSEPLSDRAWGVQERSLSRRMLHYGTPQMFFECNQGFFSEDGLHLRQRYHSIHTKHPHDLDRDEREVDPYVLSPTFTDEETKRKAQLLDQWHDLLRLYGKRKLSKASDKFPALSGLTKIYAERLQDEYVAGIWKGHLIEGILWQGLSARRVSEYRAPSWSWASMDGTPGTGMYTCKKCDHLAKVIEHKVESKGANPFGEVESGYIKLRAHLEPLYLRLDLYDPNKLGPPYERNNPRVRTANGDPMGAYSRFDFAFTAPDAPEESQMLVKSLEGKQLYALVLLKNFNTFTNQESYHCLIVRKVDEGEEFQRLGFVFLDQDSLGIEPELRGDASIITLV